MLTENYVIINRAAEACDKPELNNCIEPDNIYVALYCNEVRNVTLVTNASDVITLLWANEEAYKMGRETVAAKMNVPMSVQNIKLNRYAEEIAKKLKDGVELRVTDAVDESKMAECPECGALNPKGSMYCMDCGADL